MITKIKFDDGNEYDFSKHITLQHLSEQNIKDIMELYETALEAFKK